MVRFFSITYLCILTVAAVGVQAQTARPAPTNGQLPYNNQQVQPNGRVMPQQNPQQPANQQQNAPNASQQQPNPQQQQVAPPPDTPPSPPEVTYRDGMLTVHAINSTLGSVISAIKSKTGIEFDGAENSPDRVAISQGPAPSGEVLASIFAGSKYDFVAIGRPDSPEVVQRVILSPKKAMGSTMAAQKPLPANGGQEGDGDDTPDETVNTGDPQDTAAEPPQQPQAQEQQPQNQQPTQPKTPDQLLQELQQMKQQQQQQQQQQGDPNQNPAQVPRKPTPP